MVTFDVLVAMLRLGVVSLIVCLRSRVVVVRILRLMCLRVSVAEGVFGSRLLMRLLLGRRLLWCIISWLFRLMRIRLLYRILCVWYRSILGFVIYLRATCRCA